MIVLDENERLGRRQFLEKAFGEFFIDLPVHLPVGFPEDRPRVGDMTQGPQTLVGKSVVVPFLFLLGQPYPLENVVLVPGRHPELAWELTNFRSALPLPCATHVPPQARRMGSIAVTTPLAGRMQSALPLFSS